MHASRCHEHAVPVRRFERRETTLGKFCGDELAIGELKVEP